MNDRFSAQLRQHLLSTADERPADGRLAAIVEGVAVTAQRHPLVARLPWFPGRIDPFPSAAMRYGLIAVALIIAILGAALAVGFGQSRSAVYEGTWTSIDPADGSTQTLTVGAGISPTVHFVDALATGAACVADEVKVFTMEGIGTITDGQLEVIWPEGGGCGLTTVDVGPGAYTYNEVTDTLVDGDMLTWTRVEGSVVPPTSTLVPTSPAPPTATPNADCIQFDAAGAYTAPAGSLSLTVSVPETAGSPWHGHRDRFDLLKASCTDWQGTGYTLGAELTRVYTDACAGTSVPVDTAAAAIAAVSAAKGLEVVEETDVTLGGYPGTRFDITVSDAPNACPDQQIALADNLNPFDAGLAFTLYVIDVEGKTLALALYGYTDWDPALTADMDGMLASLRVEPSPQELPSSEPTSAFPTPVPKCFDIPAGDTYRHSAGALSLVLTVPAAANFEWQGYRDGFEVAGMCHFGRPVLIAASVVSVVHAACDRDDGVYVSTPAEAVAELAAPQGFSSSSPTDVTIAGHEATRFEISFDAGTCRDGIQLWNGRDIGRGTTIVYLVDVDGVPLGITISNRDDEATAGEVAEAEAMVSSMHIAP